MPAWVRPYGVATVITGLSKGDEFQIVLGLSLNTSSFGTVRSYAVHFRKSELAAKRLEFGTQWAIVFSAMTALGYVMALGEKAEKHMTPEQKSELSEIRGIQDDAAAILISTGVSYAIAAFLVDVTLLGAP